MEQKVIKSIINNYEQVERSIVEQLYFRHEHGTTIGGFREEIWMQMFEQIIPKKFALEQSVFLIDSKGNVSKEVDLAIFDEMYTPYIFRKGRIKFIPIEAVAVAVQCKSTNVDKDKLEVWCDSIKGLETNTHSVTRTIINLVVGPAKSQSGTRPIIILCSLENPSTCIKEKFDFTIVALKDGDGERIKVSHSKDYDLSEWHKELNMLGDTNVDYKEKDDDDVVVDDNLKRKLCKYSVNHNNKEISLLTLNFQLNQLLMLINNPMLFPHIDYVEMFNDIDNTSKEKNADGTHDTGKV